MAGKKAVKRPIGRPPMPFDQAAADFICEQIVEGKSLKRILREDKTLPSASTIFRWLAENPLFQDHYARSREAQADTLFDETLDIADDAKNDWEERKHFAGDDASPQVNGEAIARAKLRIDTRKWIAAHLRPKKYGEKIEVDQTINASDPLLELLGKVAVSGTRLGRNPDDSDDKA